MQSRKKPPHSPVTTTVFKPSSTVPAPAATDNTTKLNTNIPSMTITSLSSTRTTTSSDTSSTDTIIANNAGIASTAVAIQDTTATTTTTTSHDTVNDTIAVAKAHERIERLIRFNEKNIRYLRSRLLAHETEAEVEAQTKIENKIDIEISTETGTEAYAKEGIDVKNEAKNKLTQGSKTEKKTEAQVLEILETQDTRAVIKMIKKELGDRCARVQRLEAEKLERVWVCTGRSIGVSSNM